MKLIVSTRRNQGKRKNDVWEFRSEGEIVVPLLKLDLGEFADDEIGNARCFYGLESDFRTTTAIVKDIPISQDTFLTKLSARMMRQTPDRSINYEKQARALFQRMSVELLVFAFGTVVENRDLRILPRV